MIGILAQKGLSLFGRASGQPSVPVSSPERDKLLGLLDMLVDECDREAELVSSAGEAAGRYGSLAHEAARRFYRIEPERIADRILRH